MLVLVVLMALATLLGGGAERIYGAWWFGLLWLALTVAAGWHIWRCRLWRRAWVMGIHVSLVVILAGAALTALTAHRGEIELRQGSSTHIYADTHSRVRHLPFEMSLDSFRIQYYPGTQTARDYISHIRIDGTPHRIAMNRIASRAGYRFYQLSYHPDHQGTILRVNYDPWGTRLTYTGYALLALFMLFYLLGVPQAKFNSEEKAKANSAEKVKAKVLGLLFLFLLPLSTAAAPLPSEHEQVLWQGRAAPMGTLAKDFLTKLHGSASYRGLTPMQVMQAWNDEPDKWEKEPILRRKDGSAASLHQLLDCTTMPPRLVGVEGDPQLAEKVALALEWTQGKLVQPLPAHIQPRSAWRTQAELCYNRLDWTLVGMAGAWLLVALCLLLQRWPARLGALSQWINVGRMALSLLLALAFLLRWNAAGRIPLASGHETLHFAALCVLVVAGFSARLRHEAASLIPAAFLLLVAHLGEKDPGITPLMPVLHSPWLSAHVSIIMLSYALLMLAVVDRRMLRPAVCLLAAGIFLGAVWANVSWGAYWSWDPKETWALLTLLVYSVPLHTHSVPWLRSTRHYQIYSLVCLACLAMTYWGVNYLLGGMHSYAG